MLERIDGFPRMPVEENDILRVGRGIVFRWEIVGKRRKPASRVLNDHSAVIYIPKITTEIASSLKYSAADARRCITRRNIQLCTRAQL